MASTTQPDGPGASAAAGSRPGAASGLPRAFRRIGTVALFGLAPIAVIATMFVVGLDSRPLSHDFHFELYPEAKELLAGRNPFPGDDFDPASPPNLIWPPVAAFLVTPLTLFPRDTADVLMACLGLLCFAASLRVVGVRDWRVYGAFAMWPQVAGEMRLSHLTPQLCLLSALAWRSRRRLIVPGALVGLAVALKLFVWPLVIWLLAIRRRVAAAVSVLVAGASLLLVLPFTGLGDYVGALLKLGGAFDQDSYTVGGLALQLGLPEAAARGVTIACGAALLLAAWRHRSFALAVATALTVSPIVWLDYYAVAGIPLAIARPRVSLVWLLPLLTWGLHGAGLGIGSATGNLRLLIVFAVVLAVAVRDEPTDDGLASEPLRRARRTRRLAHAPSPQ